MSIHRWIATLTFFLAAISLSARGELRSSYPLIEWKKIDPPLDFSSAPALQADEKVDLWDPLVAAGDGLILPVNVEGGRKRLVVWDFPGTAHRLDLPDGRWSTVAYRPKENEIMVWIGQKWHAYDRATLAEKWERDAPASAGGRSDSGIVNDSWIIRDKDSFAVYDISSGEKLRAFSSPSDAKDAQRSIFLADGTILLNSTYWGPTVKRFRPGEINSTSENVPVNHRSLLKMAQLKGKLFVIFDPLTKTKLSLHSDGDSWETLKPGTEILGDWRAVRSDPLRGSLHAYLLVRAHRDTTVRLRMALPPADTYSQSIRNDRFIDGSSSENDRFGNRLLEATIALREGEEKRVELYSGKITRYRISVQLNKFKKEVSGFPGRHSFQQPDLAGLYLSDFSTYRIHDPVVEAKRNEIERDGGPDDYLKILANTLRYSATIPYKGDGKFDPAPVVIQQNHGACTEHTFVTVALLRGAGIPARYVWNFLPGEGEPPVLNHKIAEAWLPGFGWIPMEPLSPPANRAGTTYGYHLIWAAYDQWDDSSLGGGDVLYNITSGNGDLDYGRVEWSLDAADDGKGDEIGETGEVTTRSLQNSPQAKGSAPITTGGAVRVE